VATAAQAVARARASGAEAVTLLIGPGLDPLEAAMTRAALGLLATDLAPARVNAVARLDGSDEAAVEAAVAYLETARSVTGQVLEVRATRR